MRHSAALAILALAGACGSSSHGSHARGDAAVGSDVSVGSLWDTAALDGDAPNTPRLDGAAVDIAVDHISADIVASDVDASADDIPRPADVFVGARDDAAVGSDVGVGPVGDAAAIDGDAPNIPRPDVAAVDIAVDHVSADIVASDVDASAEDMTRSADAFLETATDLPPNTRCDPDRALDYFYFQAGTPYPRGLGTRMQRIWQGSTLLVVTYQDRGGDGLWLTGDDVVSSYTRMDTNGTIRITRAFTGSGPDGKWFTDDDVEPSFSLSWRCETLDAQGRAESFTTPSGRGPDGKLCTSDDTISSAGLWIPAIDSNSLFLAPDSTKQVTYSGPGPDNTWLTSDDVIVQIRRFENAPSGTASNIYVINDAGADGKWGTADDPESLSRIFTYVNSDETDMRMLLNGSFSYGLNFYCTTPAPF
jgi:hypothetical protein